VDGRHKRRERSRRAIERGIDRLQRGEGTHARHLGVTVRITKAAVALEARVSVPTVFRHADLCARIDDLAKSLPPKARAATQRRKKLVSERDDAKMQLAKAMSEIARLTFELAKYDPTLGIPQPIELKSLRRQLAQKHARW
jgi:hypothetical protein